MKNVLFGMFGAIVLVMTSVLGLSLYGTTSRNNELSHGLSQTVMSVLKAHYVGEESAVQNLPSEAEVKEEIEKSLDAWVSSDSTLAVSVNVCDFRKGILSVRVEETYHIPSGKVRRISYEKTAIHY